MAINYQSLMEMQFPVREFTYNERDTILYALGCGLGTDPMNRDELGFVYEKRLKTLPTQTTVVAWDDSWALRAGLNLIMIVHGEQRIEIKRPLPVAATILAEFELTDIFDKGEGRGAIVLTKQTLRNKSDGDVLAINRSTVFARGDGGFGGPKGNGPEPHLIPSRAPDHICDLKTRPDQALLYRLSGDRNPLHADPDFAKAAGFPQPILHGLCTFGHACHAVVKTVLHYDPALIQAIEGRFSAPIFPGETIQTEIWREGNLISFRCRVPERDQVVLNNGRVLLAN